MQDWNAFKDKQVTLHGSETGTLANRRFAVKDVYHIKGRTAGAGNPDWERTHTPAKRNAKAVDLLLRAGAVLSGTTHTDELMFSLNGENDHYGTPVNPADPTRIPGGSSSGSAVAVAAGLTDFALGTDTGGSVRVPASYCGIFGFRPTHGLVPIDGVIPLAERFDTVGWMANEAELLYDIGAALINEPVQTEAAFSKIVIPSDVMSLAGKKSREPFFSMLEKMNETKLEISDAPLADKGLDEWLNIFRTLQGYEIWQTHGKWIKETNPSFGSDIEQRFKWASTITHEDYEEAVHKQKELQSQLEEKIGKDTLVAFPTTPGIAPPLKMDGPGLEQERKRMLQLTCISGLTGYPQVSLPIMMVDGSPVGFSFLSAGNQDLRLLNYVKQSLLLLNDRTV